MIDGADGRTGIDAKLEGEEDVSTKEEKPHQNAMDWRAKRKELSALACTLTLSSLVYSTLKGR